MKGKRITIDGHGYSFSEKESIAISDAVQSLYDKGLTPYIQNATLYTFIIPTNRNWFQRMPLWARYLWYMGSGIVTGYLIAYLIGL